MKPSNSGDFSSRRLELTCFIRILKNVKSELELPISSLILKIFPEFNPAASNSLALYKYCTLLMLGVRPPNSIILLSFPIEPSDNILPVNVALCWVVLNI